MTGQRSAGSARVVPEARANISSHLFRPGETCANCERPIEWENATPRGLGEWAWRHTHSLAKDCAPGIEPAPGESYPQARPNTRSSRGAERG